MVQESEPREGGGVGLHQFTNPTWFSNSGASLARSESLSEMTYLQCVQRHRLPCSGRVPGAPRHHADIPVSSPERSKQRSSWLLELHVSPKPQWSVISSVINKIARTLNHKVEQCVPVVTTWCMKNIFSTLAHKFMARAARLRGRGAYRFLCVYFSCVFDTYDNSMKIHSLSF